MANDNDDILDPAEIESLLQSAEAGNLPPGATPAAAGRPAAGGRPMSPGDIDALLAQRGREGAAANAEALLDQAAAQLQAAIDPQGGEPSPPAEARPFEFEAFDRPREAEPPAELNNLKDVELDLRIELGRTELLIEEVLKLREGSVVALDKLAGDPVDILVNGRLVARGEVLVLNDNFCVRVAEILAPGLV